MIKLKPLKRGSKIAIISPSNGLPYLFGGIFDLGLKNLREKLGFEIVEMPTARMSTEELYRNPKKRADDINEAFRREDIDGIICSIGGYESVRILEFLDTEMILKNPKMIMGFSDATTFLTYLNTLGLITFYGPSVMAGLAQMEYLPEEFEKHLQSIFFEAQYPHALESYNKYTHGYLDWSNEETLGQCKPFTKNNDGFEVLMKSDETNEHEGYLWGGCIEVLEFLKGTKYWPTKEFWSNKFLIFETSEDKPEPIRVGEMLRNYGTQGILHQVKGIFIARPMDYNQEEKDQLKKIVHDILTIELDIHDLPVVMNVDFGHTDPIWIMPMGSKVKLDTEKEVLTLVENPFGK